MTTKELGAVFEEQVQRCREVLLIKGKEYTPEGLTIKPFSSQEISTVTTRQMLVWTIALAATPAVVIASAGILVLVKRRNA